MNRLNRFRRATLAAVAALVTTGSSAYAQSGASPMVTIDSGRISGKALDSGVKAYLGIPYAAAPCANYAGASRNR